jgi:hypothetical protein
MEQMQDIVSTEIDNNFGYEKITQLVNNIPLSLNCKNVQHIEIYLPCNFEVKKGNYSKMGTQIYLKIAG